MEVVDSKGLALAFTSLMKELAIDGADEFLGQLTDLAGRTKCVCCCHADL